MYYDIGGLCPRADIDMGRHGFCIMLYPKWRELVTHRELNQEQVETVLASLGRLWLDGCGYNQLFDPDNCGLRKDPKLPLGPNAGSSYEPNRDLRVTWGEWGPEHISVPGNACGLDLDRGFGSPRGGCTLQPHNIDNASQKLLLLVVFTWFANNMALHWELNGNQSGRDGQDGR